MQKITIQHLLHIKKSVLLISLSNYTLVSSAFQQNLNRLIKFVLARKSMHWSKVIFLKADVNASVLKVSPASRAYKNQSMASKLYHISSLYTMIHTNTEVRNKNNNKLLTSMQ